MSKEIKVKAIVYEISKGDITIRMKKEGDRINLSTGAGREDFVFQRSKPAQVRTIGELLIKAAEFAEANNEPYSLA